jgi:mono/diheme cytochrome c family protein
MIQDPVAIDWDPAGRMWVIEMPGYMHDILASDEHDPTGRIVVLEDEDKDGRMDRRTIFADGLVLPRAIKVVDRGILVAEPPNLWLMTDTNHDLKLDTKELLSNSYGRREANVEHNANSLTWAMDNWMHTSETDVYFRLTGGKLETRRTLSRGQWGNSQDDGGRIYRNSNSSVLYVDTVPTPYYTRNPNVMRQRGSYESLLGDDGEVNVVWPVRPTPGVNRGYQAGVLRADRTLATYTAVHSPTVYRGDRLPDDMRGNVFVAEPSANVVSRIIVSDAGTRLTARKAYENAEFLASTDERFRPVSLASAPDGTLYIVDMYRGIIQHRGYITEYLHGQIVARHLEPPTGLGRIYRVVHDTTQRDTTTTLMQASPAQLVAALSHPNGWWRDTAQRVLVERVDASTRAPLARLVTGAPDWRTRLHALWTLDGMNAVEPDQVIAALRDPARDVRIGAVRVAERWLAVPDARVVAAVLARVDDEDWAVRQQLGASLGALEATAREAAAATMLERHANDPAVVDAVLSGLRGIEINVLGRLLQPEATEPRTIAVTMLAATVMRSAQDVNIQRLLDWASAADRPAWQRAALLSGAEVAVLGATLPGTPPSRGRGAGAAAADAPCPTCPGGRGGPGGASAFGQRPGAAGPAASGDAAARGRGAAPAGRGAGGRGGRGGAGGPMTRLNREPASLAALAAGGGEFGARAAALLARIEWPGKPGAAAPVTPLTSREEARFEAGHTIYNNLCRACHQEDGRGEERVAPTLIGSDLALGDVGRPVRILVHGKEGPVGLMPPLGQAFNDDQIAEVLTYIRRAWGNTGDAVDPSAVRDVRAATQGRTRPWTNEELAALGSSAR